MAYLTIAHFISRELTFYEFDKGKPWIHDDLIAPFTFSILKTNGELAAENKGLEDTRDYFFGIDDTLAGFSIAQYESGMTLAIAQLDSVTKIELKPSFLSKGEKILKKVYKKGIIESPEALLQREDKTIFLKEGLSNSQMRFSEFLTIGEAVSFVTQELLSIDSLEGNILGPVLKMSLRPNIYLDRNLTDISLETKLAMVLPYKG